MQGEKQACLDLRKEPSALYATDVVLTRANTARKLPDKQRQIASTGIVHNQLYSLPKYHVFSVVILPNQEVVLGMKTRTMNTKAALFLRNKLR